MSDPSVEYGTKEVAYANAQQGVVAVPVGDNVAVAGDTPMSHPDAVDLKAGCVPTPSSPTKQSVAPADSLARAGSGAPTSTCTPRRASAGVR